MHRLTPVCVLLLLAGCSVYGQFVSRTVPPPASAQPAPPSAPGDSVTLEPIKTVKADYPYQARERAMQGQVWVKIRVSETGDVENTEVISGDPILAKAAVAAVKRWKFKPFIKDGKPVKVSTKVPFNFAFRDNIEDKNPATDPKNTAQVKPASDSPADPNSVPGEKPNRVRVAADIEEGMLIHKVAPVYPPEALRNRISGTVVLQAVIGKDGLIAQLHTVSGPPELVSAAVGAVQQWRYRPYIFNGEPVEIETTITVHFVLRGF